MSQHPHDAPFDKSTISGGLSLSNSYFDTLGQECVQFFKECDSVSDSLLFSGNSIREEELDVPGSLTRYEKKLLLAGYFIGKIHSKFETEWEERKKEMEKLMRKLDEILDSKKAKDQEGED